jgi:hypothetical protein
MIGRRWLPALSGRIRRCDFLARPDQRPFLLRAFGLAPARQQPTLERARVRLGLDARAAILSEFTVLIDKEVDFLQSLLDFEL